MAAHFEPREPWRYVVRVGVMIAALAAVAWWLLAASYFAIFRCDENCGTGQLYDWRYDAQAWLAITGAVLGVLAMAVGFSKHRDVYRILMGMSVALAIFWWVFLGTFA